MEEKQTGVIKTFISAIIILLALLIATGILTYLIPGGSLDPATGDYVKLGQTGVPIWKILASPILVLGSDSGVLVIAIILFLLVIGGAIHLLKVTGLIETVIQKIVFKYQSDEKRLLALLILVFMSLGAFVGVFEEVVPLVPMMLILARRMGWDDLTGLGVSILATGLGFAAAVTNPFTIGVAQELAGLPMFSGAGYRIFIFILIYGATYLFLLRHISKTKTKAVGNHLEDDFSIRANHQLNPKSMVFFISVMAIMFMTIALVPFVAWIREVTLPLIGLLFLIAGFGVSRLSGHGLKWTIKMFFEGAKEMSPAIILVLLATGIKYVLIEGQILDTILHYLTIQFEHTSPLVALFYTFLLVMAMNFFIGSGSAKAFILMPILMPLMDYLGIGRQLGILAFQFGDGFSNIMYPTNAVLLISLGLSKMSYGKWLKFIFPYQVVLAFLSMVGLSIGYWLNYGL